MLDQRMNVNLWPVIPYLGGFMLWSLAALLLI